VTPDDNEAVRWFREAAGQGNARGQCGLGMACASGRGVAQDAEQAVMWFRKAAEKGDPGGELNPGEACASGAGVAQDLEAAEMWFRKAAEKGLGKAPDPLRTEDTQLRSK